MDRRIFLLLLYLSVVACNPCVKRTLNALPYPDACDKYIICWHFFPYVFKCPYDLLFDVDTNNCQPPEIARCSQTTPALLTLPTLAPSTSTEVLPTKITSTSTIESTSSQSTLPQEYITLGPISSSSIIPIEPLTLIAPESSTPHPKSPSPTPMETFLPHFITTETYIATTTSAENETIIQATVQSSPTTVTVSISTEETTTETHSTETITSNSKTEIAFESTTDTLTPATDNTVSSITTEEPTTTTASATEQPSTTEMFTTSESSTSQISESETEKTTLPPAELYPASEIEVTIAAKLEETSTTSQPLTFETETTTEQSSIEIATGLVTLETSNVIQPSEMIPSNATKDKEATKCIQPLSTMSITTEECQPVTETTEANNRSEASTKRALIALPPIPELTTRKPSSKKLLPPISTSPKTTVIPYISSTVTTLTPQEVTLLPSSEKEELGPAESIASTGSTELPTIALTTEFVTTIPTSATTPWIIPSETTYANAMPSVTSMTEITSTSNTLTTEVPTQTELSVSTTESITPYMISVPSTISEIYPEESSSPVASSSSEITTNTENISVATLSSDIITTNIETIPVTTTASLATISSDETTLTSSIPEPSPTDTIEVFNIRSTVTPESNYSSTTVTAKEPTVTSPSLSTITTPGTPLSSSAEVTETAVTITLAQTPSKLATNVTEFLSSTQATIPTFVPLVTTKSTLPPLLTPTLSSRPTSTTNAPYMLSTIPPCLQKSILIPDPLDCKYFFYCNEGFWYHYSCRYGQEFSPDKLKCMRPWEAQCRARFFV